MNTHHALYPEGYAYSHFCELYRQWRQSLDVVMRQEHRAGEKLFVDFAGETVTVWEPGGEPEAQLFVAALGASSYGDSIASDVFGTLIAQIVPPNPLLTECSSSRPILGFQPNLFSFFFGFGRALR